MALPAPLLDALANFEEEAAKSLSVQEDQALTAAARWMAAVRAIHAANPRFQKKADHLREVLENLSSEVAKLHSKWPDLDEFIDFLADKEQALKELAGADVLKSKVSSGGVFSDKRLTPGQRALAIGAPQRFEKILAEVLATLRDARWRLMATRAEIEDPGPSDIYDDPQALLESLNDTR